MSFLIPKSFQKTLSLDPISSDRVIRWREKFFERREKSQYESRRVDNTSDHEFVNFDSSVFKNLIPAEFSDDDYIIFRFICESGETNFQKLNITPVIMSKKTNTTTNFSHIGGNNIPLGIKDTASYIKNYEVRRLLLKDIRGYKNDVFGIGYPIKEFVDAFGTDNSLTAYFMIDNSNFFDPKTSFALTLFDAKRPENPSEEFFLEMDFYDNGAECCPIRK